MLLGLFDYTIISILIFINFKYWNKEIRNKYVWIVLFTLYILTIPIISIIIEIRGTEPGGDSFNLLYVYFRFPTYWILTIIQLVALLIRYTNNLPDRNKPIS